MHRQNRQMHQNARLSRLMLHTPWKETDTSSYAKRCAQTVAGLWEAAAAVAEPEEVPARNVTVGRVHGLGGGVSVDLEVCITLICVWLRVCWVQVLVGCVCLRLNE